jgi:RHS repeat-associated protein
VIDHVAYDSYGSVTSESSPTNGDRFKFDGMAWDTAIGLYYDNARYYDSSIGRFLSKDPRNLSAGDSNLLRFVENNPTDLVDPSGEVPFLLPVLVIAVIGLLSAPKPAYGPAPGDPTPPNEGDPIIPVIVGGAVLGSIGGKILRPIMKPIMNRLRGISPPTNPTPTNPIPGGGAVGGGGGVAPVIPRPPVFPRNLPGPREWYNTTNVPGDGVFYGPPGGPGPIPPPSPN